jgi:hypothetical protein
VIEFLGEIDIVHVFVVAPFVGDAQIAHQRQIGIGKRVGRRRVVAETERHEIPADERNDDDRGPAERR